MIKLISINILFLAWFLFLGFISCAHGDLFLTGRTYQFSLITNLIFISLIVYALLIKRPSNNKRRMITINTLTWLSLITLCFNAYFLALITDPPYEYLESKLKAQGMSEDNILKTMSGPSQSAVTPYQNSVHLWKETICLYK